MESKRCAFIGELPRQIIFELNNEDDFNMRMAICIMKKLISLYYVKNANSFIVGLTPGIELFAARLLAMLKEKYKYDIYVESVMAYKNQFLVWDNLSLEWMHHVSRQCDRCVAVRSNYTPDFLRSRNRYIVSQADIVFAVWDGSPEGDTAWAVFYAMGQEKPIIALDPSTLEIKEW